MNKTQKTYKPDKPFKKVEDQIETLKKEVWKSQMLIRRKRQF